MEETETGNSAMSYESALIAGGAIITVIVLATMAAVASKPPPPRELIVGSGVKVAEGLYCYPLGTTRANKRLDFERSFKKLPEYPGDGNWLWIDTFASGGEELNRRCPHKTGHLVLMLPKSS